MAQRKLSIKENMLWNSFGSLVNLGCQWLITVLIVRMASGYEAAGIFSLAMSVYNMFAPVAQYRMYTYQVTDVKGEYSTGEYMAFRLLTDSIAIVLCMAYSLATCSPSALMAILLYALYKSVSLVIDVFHGCDQRNQRMDYIGRSLACQGVVSCVVFCVVFPVSGGNLEFTLLAMTLAIGIIGLAYDYPRTKQFGLIMPRISIARAARLLVRCLPIVLASVAAAAALSIPRQQLFALYGDATLGIYAAAAAPVALIQMGASYIYNPLLGYFSESYARHDKGGFLGLLVKSSLGIVLLGVVCSCGVIALGEPLLVLVYGQKMSEYGYLLLPLVALALMTGYTWFINDLLIAIRNFRGAFAGNVVSLLASLACLPLIALMGMDGVTLVCIISCVSGILVMGAMLAIQLHGYWRTDSDFHMGNNE